MSDEKPPTSPGPGREEPTTAQPDDAAKAPLADASTPPAAPAPNPLLVTSPRTEAKSPAWTWLAIGIGGTLMVVMLARVAGSALQEPPRPISPPEVPEEQARPKPPPTPEALLTVTARPIGDEAPFVAPRGDGGRRALSVQLDRHKHRTASKYAYPTDAMALDAAKAALDAKDPHKALAILDQYDADFPGELSSTDAKAMRIEALAMVQKRDEALQLAEQFLEDYPHSPKADRVRAIKSALQQN